MVSGGWLSGRLIQLAHAIIWVNCSTCVYIFISGRIMAWVYKSPQPIYNTKRQKIPPQGRYMSNDDVIKWKYFPRYWPFVREFTGHRWIPRTKASDAELWCFFSIGALNKRLSKQSWGWWFETPTLSLWRHCNGIVMFQITNNATLCQTTCSV